ncbi:MAG: hypothetical protein JW830_01615 [Bacteroidales bacterium]|nr:hypothetical protein [Bacteroidales bacterium]
MKTFFTRHRVWIWILLFLLILNFSVVATLLYRNLRLGRINTHPPVTMRFNRQGPGVFLKDELNLSDEQFNKYMEFRNEYQNKALQTSRHINSLRRSYMHALIQDKPDKVLMQETCDSIGTMHARMMQETGNYYFQIRQLCHDDQVEKLNTFFLRVMDDEGNAGMRGRDMRRGMRQTGRQMRDGRF